MAEQPRLSMPPHGARQGLTLVELLIAAALSLMVMGTLAGLFGLFGSAIKRSEATMNLSGLMRSAAWQLRQDLAGVTCPLAPWLAPESNAGYFELIEGADRDTTYAISQGMATADLKADTDDLLLFTTQSLADAFVGRFEGKTIESPFAEVAWFCRPAVTQPAGGPTVYDLHRRQLLIVNYIGQAGNATNTLTSATDRAGCDISLRSGSMSGAQVLLPNSLSDLTKRENRFMRGGYSFMTEAGATRSVTPQVFPYAFPLDATGYAVPEAALDGTKRATEDVVLTNVIAFDVRVFDPQAVVSTSGGTLERAPGDPGYSASSSGDLLGAYVDLGWGGGSPGLRTDVFPPAGKTAFQSAGVKVADAPSATALTRPTYDTWSRHYEFNGVDEDGDGIVDEAVNGIDGTDADTYPEDTVDLETSPPYPVPLRGIEVRIRCYEPSSRQVRQVTVRHTFVK